MKASEIYGPRFQARANALLGIPESRELWRIRHPFIQRLRAEGKDRPAPRLDFLGALRMIIMVAIGFVLATAVLEIASEVAR